MRLLIASSTVLLLFVAVHFAQSATPGDPRAADLGPPAANWNVIEGIQPTAASQEWESHRARPVVSGPVRPNLPARPALDTPAFLPSESPSFAAIDMPPQAQIALPPMQAPTDRKKWFVSPASYRAAQPAGEQPRPAMPRELVDTAAAQIARGGLGFDSHCTQCHDANRATAKRKSFAGWLATVRKMAAKRDADIPSSDVVPIARYLADLNGLSSGGADVPAGALNAALEAGQFNFSATISTLWRGGNDSNVIENPGFFADVWLSAEWQSSGPLSMRVTSCVTCHESVHANRLELVEAFAKLDLVKAWRGSDYDSASDDGMQLGLSAGRIVVPFGAFASMSHPGANRTVTNPLMFNMGRLVNTAQIGPVVLPMPYADEGAVLDVRLPLACGWSATLDVYAINGLQGFTRISDFLFSRNWVDNNSDPAVGGRATIGNGTVRLGGSIMAGRFDPDSATNPVLNYQLVGADATVRLGRWRGYLEYAMRRSDFRQGMTHGDEEVYGTVAEIEYQLLDCPQVSLLARYDNLIRNSTLSPPVGFRVERLTLGINVALPGGSLLMFNYERWRFPDPVQDVDDIIGIRWVATF